MRRTGADPTEPISRADSLHFRFGEDLIDLFTRKNVGLVGATQPSIAGTYLLINNGKAGRNNSADLLINISGYAGELPGLGAIAVNSVFA